MNPFANHPCEEVNRRWERRFRCKICGFEFTWGEDDIDFCEHLNDKQPVEWLIHGLVELAEKHST